MRRECKRTEEILSVTASVKGTVEKKTTALEPHKKERLKKMQLREDLRAVFHFLHFTGYLSQTFKKRTTNSSR